MKNIQATVFFVFAVVCAVITRMIQILFLINPHTGFSNAGCGTLNALLTAFIVALCVIVAILLLLKKQNISTGKRQRSFFLFISSLLIAVAQLTEPFIGPARIYNIPSALWSLRLIFIFASGFVFAYFAVAEILLLPLRQKLFVIPVISFVLRLMCTFISYTEMSNISDNFLDIATLICILLFLVYYAKISCNIAETKHYKYVQIFGLSAIILCFTTTLPRIIINFFATNFYPHSSIDSVMTLLIMPVYIISCLVNLSKNSIQ